VPSATGGGNWPGGALDPETNRFYVYTFRAPSVVGLVPGPKPEEFAYVNGQARDPGLPPVVGPTSGDGGGAAAVTVQGLPLLKPPYGTISAIDLNKGEIAWQVPHGETPDAVKNHPALKGLNSRVRGARTAVPAFSSPVRLLSPESPGSVRHRAGDVARCSGPMTRPRVPKSAPSTCLHRKPVHR
jgi:hypothetical protein